MKNQGSGIRNQESWARDKSIHEVSHPELPTLDPACMERVRWRCRRGLLELDIVLGRFIEQCYPGLDEVQQISFDALLDMPDNDLWDMISGRGTVPLPCEQLALLEKIRAV